MAKKKAPRGDAEQQGQPPAKQPWHKSIGVLPWTALGACLGWLLLHTTDAFQTLRDTPGEARKTWTQFQSWVHEDSEWTGKWTTSPEGVIDTGDMNLSGDDLQVTIWATGGDIDGTIATTRICQSVPFDYVLLRGKVSGNNARVVAWDTVRGRKFAFAELELKRDGAIMTVKPLDGLLDWFPKTARIAREPLEEGAVPKPDTTFCDAQQRARLEPKV